ncbi:serine/threonine protein kinase [Plesiocystis pacifica SIR-1]|uniref:Serine/threonine protein kinase n=1 Tax=Plesiocystis pacifica SIR-1 TaxID=391625 RepID=A6G517_9BACT|nr:serine/threonine-protein kinase [Plesiocystis pacifica]EDM79109.1 serine/threonine protein kinase [Plesiocystis pacifica SIR-1]
MGDGLAGDDTVIGLADALESVESSAESAASEPRGPRLGPDEPRSRLGAYTLLRRLGSGGMGEVFAARHEPSGDEVALKLLSEAAATRLYRFKREFRTLADVSHPNLVELRELVVRADLPAFFTMELIDGEPFVARLRPDLSVGELPDLDRLRAALGQLLDAVAFLHARGYVHRDLKPANVLLSAEGRAVVLDFGLVAASEEVEVGVGVTRDGQLLGTPRYMAPEQAMGRGVGPAADLYAVGVMLYESLRGEPPFVGTAMQLLLDKQTAPAPDPGPEVPEELRALCRALLAREPEARPSAAAARARLSVELREVLRPPGDPSRAPFVGRTRELEALAEAFNEASRGGPEPTIVHVHGPSGHGKSRLILHACARMRDAGGVVLRGRCRQREVVPYKGLDAVVDALSAYLRQLPVERRDPLEPRDADVLARMFPVLDELWPPRAARTLEPPEQRRLGAASLAQLLRTLAAANEAPLVVHVDDLQWADHDTIALLEVLAAPSEDAQASGLVMLLSYRSEGKGGLAPTPALAELSQSSRLSGPAARHVALERLSFAAARELAEHLLEPEETGARPSAGAGAGGDTARPKEAAAQAEAIAMRAQGIPFYITQLAHRREVSTHDSEEDLDIIVARRLFELSKPERALLELIAVYGGPMESALALALNPEVDATVIERLAEQGLLLRAELEGTTQVELAHDRVREVAIARLDAQTRGALHWRLGQALRERLERVEGGDGEPGFAYSPTLFLAADHLAAALEFDAPELDEDARRALVRLEHQAGRHSLETGAWHAARRYLRCAHESSADWLEAAARGRDPDSAALLFDLAQAEFALDPDRAMALCRELMSWELDAVTLSEVLDWHNSRLMLIGAWEQGVEPAIAAARRLGFRVPRMTLLRSLSSYALGWRALRRSGMLEASELVLASPAGLSSSRSQALTETDATDATTKDASEQARVLLNVVGTLAQTPVFIDPKLSIWAYGQYGRLLARHGAHESMGTVLVRWALSATVIGRVEQARAMAELVRRSLSNPQLRVPVSHGLEGWLSLLLAILYPLREVGPQILTSFDELRRAAPQPLVEVAAGTSSVGLFPATPLPKLLALVESARGASGQWEVTLARGFLQPFAAMLEAAIDPSKPRPTVDFEHPDINELSRGLLAAIEAIFAVARGDLVAGRAAMARVPPNYGRAFGPMPTAPMFACVAVIMLSSGAQGASARVRTHRRVARKWARLCPETYGAVEIMIDAERTAARGRPRDAIELYEQAIDHAQRHGVLFLRALASHRLGKLALARGNAVLARGALDGAKEAHQQWGHGAGVAAIEAEEASVGYGRTSR